MISCLFDRAILAGSIAGLVPDICQLADVMEHRNIEAAHSRGWLVHLLTIETSVFAPLHAFHNFLEISHNFLSVG